MVPVPTSGKQVLVSVIGNHEASKVWSRCADGYT